MSPQFLEMSPCDESRTRQGSGNAVGLRELIRLSAEPPCAPDPLFIKADGRVEVARTNGDVVEPGPSQLFIGHSSVIPCGRGDLFG